MASKIIGSNTWDGYKSQDRFHEVLCKNIYVFSVVIHKLQLIYTS